MDTPGFTGPDDMAQDINIENGVHQRDITSSLPRKDQSGTDKDSSDSGSIVVLKKRMGLTSGVALIVGTMIGSGIFVSPKGVVEGSGSVGFSLVNWGICGVIAMSGALCYSELGTMIPRSGGEHAYLGEAFGPIPAFLFSWVNMFLLKPSSLGILSLTCAEYVMVALFDDGCGTPPEINRKLFAAAVICLLAMVNCYSVKIATKVQVIFTIAKLVALTVIIIGGVVMLAKGHTENLETGFQGTTSQVGVITIGLYNGLWSYDGWNNLNYATEELINPYVNLPRSILIGLPLVTALYVFVNISYFTVMSVDQLLASPAVAITWAETVIPKAKVIIPIAVALSTFGAANGSLFTSGRINFVAAREGHTISILSMIHVQRYTPSPSIIFTALLSLILIIPANIGALIDFFNFVAWFFYGGSILALVVMRYTRKDLVRPYKVPLPIPIAMVIVSAFLVLAPIIDNPQIQYLYALLAILAGLIFYIPFVHYKKSMPGMEHITTVLQMVLQVCPTEVDPTL